MAYTLFGGEQPGPLDQRLQEIFQNKAVRQPATDSITLESLREIVDSPGYTYTWTTTLDTKKKKYRTELVNDSRKQWRHIKKVMLLHVDKYKYRSIMVPEFHKNDTRVHAHGIVHFKVDNYDDACLQRSKLVKKLHVECGRMIQWTRINQSVGKYMPSESNVKIKEKQSLEKWHEYLHKHTLRKHYGIQDLVNF